MLRISAKTAGANHKHLELLKWWNVRSFEISIFWYFLKAKIHFFRIRSLGILKKIKNERKGKLKKYRKINLGRSPFLQICRNGNCPFFQFWRNSFFQKHSILSAQVRHEVDVSRGLGDVPQQAFLHWIRIHALLANFIPNSIRKAHIRAFLPFIMLHKRIK